MNCNCLIIGLVFFASILNLSCAKKDALLNQSNPYDENGINFNPPQVAAMDDTYIGIFDSLALRAQGSDKNGSIQFYIWICNEINLYDTSFVPPKIVFQTAGPKQIFVKCIDNDGIVSMQQDTINVIVHEYRPVMGNIPDIQASVFDTFSITPSGVDTNGTVAKYIWICNELGLSDTITEPLKIAFSTGGSKQIFVKCIDSDGFVSVGQDTVNVDVHENRPAMKNVADIQISVFDTFSIAPSAFDTNGTISKFVWATDNGIFKDTTTSIMKMRFTHSGYHNVYIRCIDNHGYVSLNTDTVLVNVLLNPPTLTLSSSSIIYPLNDTIHIKANAIDSNGFIIGYSWSTNKNLFPNSVANNDSFNLILGNVGNYKVFCKAFDDDSIYTLDSIEVSVRYNKPVLFLPDDNSTMQEAAVTLQWHPGYYNTYYEILCDTIPIPTRKIKGNYKDTMYTIEESLKYSANYYWRIVAFNKLGQCDTSNTFLFTTVDFQAVTHTYDFEKGIPFGEGWKTGGANVWFSSLDTANATLSLQSGVLSTQTDSSWIEITIPGPMLIQFYGWNKYVSAWMGSAIPDGDFYIDNYKQGNISTLTKTRFGFSIPSGMHTLRWQTKGLKQIAVDYVSKNMLIDDVQFTPAP